MSKAREKWPKRFTRRVKFVARRQPKCNLPVLFTADTQHQRQTAENYHEKRHTSELVLVFGNRAGRSGRCELHFSCAWHKDGARGEARHCIVADTYLAATCFDRCERPVSTTATGVVPDRTEITAEESGRQPPLSSRSSFIHPPLLSYRVPSTARDGESRGQTERLRFR